MKRLIFVLVLIANTVVAQDYYEEEYNSKDQYTIDYDDCYQQSQEKFSEEELYTDQWYGFFNKCMSSKGYEGFNDYSNETYEDEYEYNDDGMME